jgi:mannose-6-phosphate isomerase-like protein (cupin superfamily)
LRVIAGAGLFTDPGSDGSHWTEHFRTDDLSVGTYSITAGGIDDQSPHTEDEIYVVISGRASIETPEATAKVGPGSVIFVPANEEHRFVDVTEDLAMLVLFAPAEGSLVVK